MNPNRLAYFAAVVDAGSFPRFLVAADRSKRRIWAEHRARLEAGLVAAAKREDVDLGPLRVHVAV